MTRNSINPDHMYNAVQFGFSHVIESAGQRTVHLAGQVAWDGNGELVGAGDLRKQCEQVFRNLRTVLAEVDMKPSNVIRLRTYCRPMGLGRSKISIAAF